MFCHKVFHVHQPLEETRRLLGRVGSFANRIPGLKKAVVTADGVAQFECVVDPKTALHAVLVELPIEAENHVYFHSTVGNVKVAGVIALTAIRPGLTEVELVVDYSLCSLMGRLMNFCTHRVERYLDDTVRHLQECLNGNLPSAYFRAERHFTDSPALGMN